MSERTIKVRDQKPGECCQYFSQPIKIPVASVMEAVKKLFGDQAILVTIPDCFISVYAVEEVPQFGVAMKDDAPDGHTKGPQ